MARRRLSLPGPDAAPAPAAPAGAPEVKAWGLAPPGRPPIAQVAGDAAAASALHEMSRAFEAARLEGRLVQRLPLAAIAADHLLRDRIAADEEAMEALVASLRAHGQRVPVEVEDLGGGRYGLISGWRRLAALARLAAEEGGSRFGTVLAFVRSPAGAADAYVAMVEENEVRLGLSYYERARIVARAADLGVFASEREALARLFASGSRARRSKIGSFVTVVRALDGHLRFPAALPERLGLRLAQAIAAGAGPGLAAALDAAAPGDAAAEQALLARALAPRAAGGRSGAADPPAPPPAPQELRPGVFLTVGGGFLHPVLTLSGPGVGPEFRERLTAWIETGR